MIPHQTRRWRFARLARFALAAGATCGSAPGAAADIIATTGDLVEIEAAASVDLHVLESSDFVRAFNERQVFTLDSNLFADITQPGEYDDEADLTSGFVPAGTRVSSHFLHFDPVGSAQALYDGSITFDDEILAVIVTSAALDGSDGAAGLETTVYPSGGLRGLEDIREFLWWEAGGSTLFIRGRAMPAVDQVRVITHAVPAPGSLALACLAVGCVMRGRNRPR